MNLKLKPLQWKRYVQEPLTVGGIRSVIFSTDLERPFPMSFYIGIDKHSCRSNWSIGLGAHLGDEIDDVVCRTVRLPSKLSLEEIIEQYVPGWKQELRYELACHLELRANYLRNIPAS